MVEHVQPFAPVLRGGVERKGLVVEGSGDEQGDDLLWELVGAVVVRAVRYGNRQPERLPVRAHRVVRASLRGVVGSARAVGALLVERLDRIERKVTVDLASGYVMKPC